jgi:hypothetical protein
MKTFEIFVSAGYITDGGSKESNCFKEYVEAKTAADAKKILRSELKADGYICIKMDDPIEVR